MRPYILAAILVVLMTMGCAGGAIGGTDTDPAMTEKSRVTEPIRTDPAGMRTAEQDGAPLAGSGDGTEDVHYSSCREAREAGAAPMVAGQPGYRLGLDRDRDGVACQ